MKFIKKLLLNRVMTRGRKTGRISAAQWTAWQKVKSHKESMAQLMAHADGIVVGKMGTGKVGKIGDGTILQLLLDHLPQLLAFIEALVKLFGL